jgi:hypothetical protein
VAIDGDVSKGGDDRWGVIVMVIQFSTWVPVLFLQRNDQQQQQQQSLTDPVGGSLLASDFLPPLSSNDGVVSSRCEGVARRFSTIYNTI